MPSLEREAYRLRSLIDDADAIIVGIGSGMSSAAGFNHYNRAGMARAGMADWQQAFGFKSLFDGFYHLYPSLEQQWAYYARYIDFMLREPTSQPYLDLRSLIGHKDYFILSTNVDTQVEKTFPTERICNYQGSFAHLQCKQPCCDELFDASPYVERMLAGMEGFEVRSEDVPRCPHCGWQLVPWVRDDTFLQGAAWRESLGRYERFVRERSDRRVLLLELGVGEMTPGHHHAPVLEHDREAAGCAPFERKHLGRLGSVAAWKQGRGDPGRFGRPALGGAGRWRVTRSGRRAMRF